MKVELQKRNFKVVFSMLFFAFGVAIVHGQTAATATWALTSNGNVAVTGAVTGSNLVIGAGINTPTYTGAIGVSTNGWANDAAAAVSDEYYEYSVTPTAGNTFYINSIVGEHSRSTGNWLVDFNYSFDNFATSISLGSLSINTSTSTGFNATGLNIAVPSGVTFSLRIYGYESDGSNRRYRNRAIVFTGVTCASTTIDTQPVGNSYCEDDSFTLTSSFTNATGYQWYKNGVAVSGATSASYTNSSSVTGDTGLYYVIGTNDCGGSVQSNTVTVSVNPKPTSITATPSATTICQGETINLTASAVTNSIVTSTLISENFNGVSNSWTKINNSTGGTPANAAWTLRPNNFTSSFNGNLSSNDSSQFYFSDSDAQGTGSTTATILQSPTFSTIGLDEVTFSFYQFYRDFDTSDFARVEISTDGTNWTTLQTYTTDQGTGTAFDLEIIDLSAYVGEATVSVRFKYDAVWAYYWAVDNVLITGVTNSGPATYEWTSTPSGFTSSEQNPTGVSPTVNTTYTVTVTNNNDCSASATSVEVIVNPVSVGGTVTGGTAICSGAASGLLTLSGNTGDVVRWESAVSPFSTWNPIANTSSTYTSGVLTETTQFRAVVQNGVCAEANSSPTTVSINSTTWTSASGGSWDNGTPSATTAAIIEYDYTSAGNLDACSLLVTNNANVLITSGDSVNLIGSLTVDSGSSFTLENNANLLQEETSNNNSGAIIVNRNSSALLRQDYTLWSAPVAGQNLLDFSPSTVTSRFYTYSTTANQYSSVVPSTTDFANATGYLIRMPNNHPTTPTVWTGTFEGVPNNGDYTFTMTDNGVGQRFNAVGNPYPSPLNAVDFVSNTTNAANTTGTLYFWRKTNNAASPSYCSWTTGGFVTNSEAQVFDPNDVLQTGQGFFVEASGNGTSLEFNNTMRIDDHANQFFRMQSTERHRIWLNATNAEGLFSQTLVGYMTNATNDVDYAIDGKHINDGAIALTSLINDETFVIQGRSLPFETTDVVPLQFKATSAGNYTIAIDHVDGLFLESQPIYLRDLTMGFDHNLKVAEYNFTSDAGTFSNRFEIVYESTLTVSNPILENTVVVYSKNKTIEINSGSVPMNNVKVFDMRGRLVAEQKDVTATTISIQLERVANQVLIVQLSSIDGQTISKKVVH